MASPASALTLGTNAYASGPDAGPCSVGALLLTQAGTGFATSMPSTTPGIVTSWSYDATAAPAGKKVTLVVLKPLGNGYTVTGVDNQTVPVQATPGLATFVPSTPLLVAPGGSVGLYSPEATGDCTSSNFSRVGNIIRGLPEAAAPSPGTVLGSNLQTALGEINLSAQVTPISDLGLTAVATPASISVGDASALVFPVSERYGAGGSTAFTATMPSGLRVVAAAVSGNTCQVSGPVVTCAVAWRAGTTPPTVVLVVTADVPGAFSVSGTVGGGAFEETPGNNSAAVALEVTPPAPPASVSVLVPGPVLGAVPVCSTVEVGGLTVSLAKRVLTALNCQPTTGKATSSKTVKKGLVITTNPGPGKTLANGAGVSLIPSSGAPKKKTSKKKKKS